MSEGPPLRRWELQGFRSIRDRVNIDLGQMNVLVGANSAGKSSLIQSILLAAQTLGTTSTPKPLILNGSLVQLGLPDDCVNEQAKGLFSFAFTYSTPDDLSPGLTQRLGTVKVDATFSVKGSDFELSHCAVSAEPEDDDSDGEPIEQSVSFRRGTKAAMRDQLREHGLKGRRLDAILGSGVLPVQVSKKSMPFVSAARFRQFLPHSLYEVENRNLNGLIAVVRAAEQAAAEGRIRPGNRVRILQTEPRAGFRYRTERIPRIVAKFVAAFLRAEGIKFVPDKKQQFQVPELLAVLPSEAFDVLPRMLTSDWFEEHLDDLRPDMGIGVAASDEPFDSLILSARRFFSGYVRHLGPIRVEPKPLYGLSEAASGDSVGSSGEYTAALLDAYGDMIVQCPLIHSDEVIQTYLSEAVDYWLRILGLLSSVAVQERGKLGYEVNLRIDGVRKTLDLTAVGVGVSQALPVIVQGLVAPPGSLVLLEQPELHLHPDVQAAVADFCLALAASGRQIILETHSEYLVNRIRRRAVEDDGDQVRKLVKLHFVEREDGATSVRPVTVTEYGGLEDWPAGFMDQSARESEAIIEAVERRAAMDDQSHS